MGTSPLHKGKDRIFQSARKGAIGAGTSQRPNWKPSIRPLAYHIVNVNPWSVFQPWLTRNLSVAGATTTIFIAQALYHGPVVLTFLPCRSSIFTCRNSETR